MSGTLGGHWPAWQSIPLCLRIDCDDNEENNDDVSAQGINRQSRRKGSYIIASIVDVVGGLFFVNTMYHPIDKDLYSRGS